MQLLLQIHSPSPMSTVLSISPHRRRLRHSVVFALIALASLLLGFAAPAAADSLQAPAGVQAVAESATDIRISWYSAPRAVEYRVLRGTTKGGPYTVVGASNYVVYGDAGLTPGTTYYYVVQSVNRQQLSPYSAEVSATTPLQPPTGVQARERSTSEIELSWEAATNASQYRVLRGESKGGPYTVVTTTAAPSHIDSGLESGTNYYYVVQSVNGELVSPYSAEAGATTRAVVLTPPRNFKANFDGTSTQLSWDAVAGATRYQVFYISPADDSEVVLGTTTDTHFTHTPAQLGGLYPYKVRAIAGTTRADSALIKARSGAYVTTTTLSVSPNSTELGQFVVLTATVEAVGRPKLEFGGDDVEFFMDDKSIGRAYVYGDSPHQAVLTFADAPVGDHDFYAQYEGEDFVGVAGSASSTLSHTVKPAYGGLTFAPYSPYKYGTLSNPRNVATADVTGDGLADALMTTQIGSGSGNPDTDFRLMVFEQRADHTLAPPRALATNGATFYATMRLATGDLDADGDTDVAVAVQTGIDIFRQIDGTLTGPVQVTTTSRPTALQIADINKDGRGDLVIATPQQNEVRLSMETGEFGEPIVVGTGGLGDVADMNSDGLPDIVTRVKYGFSVYPQTSAGGFAAPLQYDLGHNFSGGVQAARDVTGDEKADVIGTGSFYGVDFLTVSAQSADGGVAQPVVHGLYNGTEAVTVADMDNDGRLDVIAAHTTHRAGVLLQRPDGSLGREQIFPTPSSAHFDSGGVAAGDVTGDGKADILIADPDAGLVVLRQT